MREFRLISCLLLGPALGLALGLAPAALAQNPEDETPDTPPMFYDSQGRRDPFRPTIGIDKGSGDRCASRDGMAKVLLQEVKLTGITMTNRGAMAMWEGGPANQGYFSYEGDEFCDGTVFSIDFANKVVIVRQIRDDPKLLRPWNDVPRHLYPEDASAAEALTGAALGTNQQATPRRGPGNLARPNTAAKPGTMITPRQ